MTKTIYTSAREGGGNRTEQEHNRDWWEHCQ